MATKLRQRLLLVHHRPRYLESAIAEDWPAMERGNASLSVTRTLNDLYATALSFNPNDLRGATLLAEILHQLDLVTQARRDRLVMASGIVPAVVWLGLFGGAARDHRLHFLLWHRESPRADNDVWAVVSFYFLWLTNYYCYRLSICWNCKDTTRRPIPGN
jgi:hypothetical protein